MWRSVPQMPAWVTAMSTSRGPTCGIGASGTYQRPGSPRSFRSAFIVCAGAPVEFVAFVAGVCCAVATGMRFTPFYCTSVQYTRLPRSVCKISIPVYRNRLLHETGFPEIRQRTKLGARRTRGTRRQPPLRPRPPAPQEEGLDAGRTLRRLRRVAVHAFADRTEPGESDACGCISNRTGVRHV